MTGSDMGGLVASFAKIFAAIFAVLFAIGGLFASGVLQVVLLVVASLLAVAYFFLRAAINKADARYYANRAEQRQQERARNPELWGAMDKLQELAATLPGRRPVFSSGCGYGMTSVAPDAKYALWVDVEVDDWDGETPRSVAGVPYADVQKLVPAEIDGFKVIVKPNKPHRPTS